MPAYATKQLRNVALLSHSGTGKTTMGEAMLFACGATSRMGRVEDGNTVSDYEPEEAKRRSSIQLSVLPCKWRDHKLNIIDTPGYWDFVGEVVSTLRAVDAAVLVVAAQAGVEVGTEDIWQRCEERGLPRMVFVNKMDRENADFRRSLESIQNAFGKQCVAIHVPIGSQQSFQGVVSLLNPGENIPAAVAGEVEQLRERLIEAVAESDDELATKYLEGQEITQEELVAGLKKGVLAGQIVPVLAGAASVSLGIKELLDAIIDLLPSPADVPPVEAERPGGGDKVKLDCNPSGALAAQVFKTTADPFVGKLSYFRVYRGAFKADAQVWNATKAQSERVAQVFVPMGKTQEGVTDLAPGDLGAVAKLTATTTGDTLCLREEPLLLPAISFPEPVFTTAVTPKGKADVDKMATSLARLTEEDPTLHLTREILTSETLLSGQGETHTEVAVERARRKFGVELLTSLPRIPYQETISSPAKVEYKHKKQSGGHGQYGHVFIELEPLPRGGGFEFGEKVVGGNVPKEYIPAVQKGVEKTLPEGAVAGYPLVDLKVILYDGSSHPVDSSGMSFEIAGAFALKKGVMEARPVLLEPVVRIEVTVPDAYAGQVAGDLNTKRARILGMTPQSGGMTVVEAEAPQAEVRRYATELRSITGGRGKFRMEFAHYAEVPTHITQRIIDESKRERVGA
ncbi:MAG: elongation factor G [Chloroflexi bacterium]|nr:elongation factor G [Chloroflexota bacterium]